MTLASEVYTHRGLIVFVAGLTISKAIGALPEPKESAGPFYTWFYAFSHSMVSAIKLTKPPV